MNEETKHFYEFGAFHLDPVDRLLLHEEKPVALTPKVFDTLLVLVRNDGRLIEKERLIKELWPDSFVEEGNLTYNISVLRKSLGVKAPDQHYIVTVPGYGYRFEGDVKKVGLEQYEAIFEPQTTLSPAQRILKNKAVIAASLFIVFSGLMVYWLGARPKPVAESPPKSIAVLPFKLLNAEPGDSEIEYLSDGISESLINSLSQLPGMKVTARSSSFKYKGKDADPQDVAQVLGVDAILTGRVLQRGAQLQISVELIDTRNKTQIWGELYNRRPADLLAVQLEISREIARKLRLKLTAPEQQQLAKRETTNPEAYELRLRGASYARKGGTENRLKGIEFFNQAISVDPNYAQAYAALSNTYGALGLRPKAQAAAKKALELDENLAEAHVAMANLYRDDWDWATAEAKYQHAIELNPNLMRARVEYSDYLSYMGRFDQALVEIQRARELDPLNQHINNTLGSILFLARRYDEALIQAKNTLELDNSFLHAYYSLGVIYTAKGMYREAIDAFQELNRLGGIDPITQIYVGVAYVGAGERGKAQAILKHLETSKEYVPPGELAVLYTSLGEREKAFVSLEKAYAAHHPELQYLKVNPDFDSLRSDPRFEDLMRRVGLSQ